VRFQWNAEGTALYLEAVLNEVRNVWRVEVNPATLEWVSAERLTTGSGPDVAAALSRDGKRMAFTLQRQSIRLWAFPFDSSSGRISGKGSAITPEDTLPEGAALSPDGRFVGYSSSRRGSRRVELLLADIDANTSEVVGVDGGFGAWSPDSKTFAYALERPDRPPPGEWALAVRRMGGAEQIIGRWSAESVLLPTGWTCDGRAILGSYLSPLYIGIAKLALWPIAPAPADHIGRILLEDPNRRLFQGQFSPDCRWLSFVAQTADDPSHVEINVVPASGAPAAQWVRIAPDHPWKDKPRWAPDGKTLYFISNQGSSYFNLWGVRFDRDRGRTLGAPFKITTFDSPDLVFSPDTVSAEIGVSARRTVLPMASVTGNIWMLENADR
jgi:Tol biopolymer transport system component